MRSAPPVAMGEDMDTAPALRLGAEDAVVLDTFVVPRYLALFAEQLVEMIAAGRDARVCHLQCRSGYPDRLLLEKLPNAHVYGCDGSEHAIELACAKARTIPGFVFDYRVSEDSTTPFPAAAFSHGITLHAFAAPARRRRMLEELARLLAPRGQALVAMPLRGSFAEITDLLREHALKSELTALTSALEAAEPLRPTGELLARELEAVGFEYVEVDVRTRAMRFESGRRFSEDPVTRLMLVPELRESLGLLDERALDYVRAAIDKYWSDVDFELTVNVGVVSGRRKN